MSGSAPIVEWSSVRHTSSETTLLIHLIPPVGAELGKLTLKNETGGARIHLTSGESDDSWQRNNSWNWMWEQTPRDLNLTFKIQSDEVAPAKKIMLEWEHLESGQRHAWSLGEIELVNRSSADPSAFDHAFHRTASRTSNQTLDVHLSAEHINPGAFVKWTEFIPEGCVCDVIDPSGASVRSTPNSQIFLWFQVKPHTSLTPKYRLTCQNDFKDHSFDGEIEVAFGSETKISHISYVEWVELDSTSNESMELELSSDAKSVTPIVSAPPPGATDQKSSINVRYAVQLLANHRDLEPFELEEELGYHDDFHIFRHQGWHKYLTDDKSTYVEARDLRSYLWTTTKADDAFVTASLDGERISVQEALLLSNQMWIP